MKTVDFLIDFVGFDIVHFAHNVTFCWFLGPETDSLCQFLDPENLKIS